jgi:hypothetical protein
MKTIWLLTLATILFIGCHSASESSDAESYGYASTEADFVSKEESAPEPAASPSVKVTPNGLTDANLSGSFAATQPSTPTIKTPDKIIKTGYIEMEVDNYAKTLSDLAQRVQAAQGYISSQNEQRDNFRITNTLSIRVVNQNFDALVNGLGEIAKKVVSKSINMQDVSEEYTDVAARLKTKKEVAARYSDILKSAKTIKDILAVEEQLRVIREEIESSEGRLKYLNDQVSYSTITLQVYEELEYHEPAPLQANFGQKLLSAVTGGWNGLLGFTIGLVTIWPMLIVMVISVVLIVRRVRRRRVVA